MSFQINKDSKGNIIKKNIPVNSTNFASISNYSNSLSLVNSNTYESSISSLTINGQPLVINQTNINYLNAVNAGTAIGEKAIILDSSKNITNINNINCSKFNINGNELKTTVSTTVVSNNLLSDISTGVASSKSAIVVDSSKNITNLNSVKANSIDNSSFSIASYTNNNLLFTNNGYLSNNEWKDFCWSQDNRLLVAVGNSCIGYSSNSGISWDYTSSTYNLKKIIWVDFIGMFIAIGDNTLITSSDAISWSDKSISGNLNSIAYKNGLIVTVGNSCSFYSTNGLSWTSSTISEYNWTDICYGNNIFITCSDGYVSKSTDGIVWTNIALTGSWISICYGNQGFLVASNTTNTTNKIFVSLNGNIWNSMNSSYLFSFSSSISKIYYIRAIQKYFILCQNVGVTNPAVYVSNDMYSWNSLKLTNNNIILSISWSNYLGSVLMLGSPYYSSEMSTNNLYTFEKTSNIVNFQDTTGTFTSVSKMIENENIIHALSSSALLYSTDGYEFKACKINGVSFANPRVINYITYSPLLNIYVTACNYSTTYTKPFLYSSDGINWIECTINTTLSPNSVIWNNNLGKFYATFTSSAVIMISSDGISWSVSESNTSNTTGKRIEYIEETNRMFILLTGGTNSIYTSITGESWTLVNNSFTAVNIVYYNNKYYTVNTAGTQIYSSADGITWSVEYTCVGVTGLIINTINNILAGFASNSIYLYDGTTWSNITPTNLSYPNGIASIYSKYYKCIYAGNSIANSIIRSRSFKSCLLSSYSSHNVDKSYKFLNISDFNDEVEDRILTSLSKYTTSTLLDAASTTSLFYSKKYNTFYTTSSSLTSSSVKYSTDNFGTLTIPATSTSRSYGVLESGETIIVYGYSFYHMVGSTLTSSVSRAFSSTNYIKAAASDGNQVVMLSFDNNAAIQIAIDMINNTYIPNTFKTTMNCIAYGNGVFAILGNNNSYYIKNYNTILAGDFTSDIMTSIVFGRDKFVGVGTNKIIYSYNGINWLTSSSDTYTWKKIIYVKELEVYLACCQNTIGYSFDGISWKFVTTAVSNTWIDIAYNSYFSTIHLLGGNTPRLFTTSCLVTTPYNVTAPVNAKVNGDKLILNASTTIIDKNSLTHSLELDGQLRLNTSVFGTDGIFQSSGKLNILNNTAKYINISNHNGSTTGLKIGGVLLKSSATDLNNISTININNAIQKNGLAISDSNGNINMNTISSFNSLNVANSKLISMGTADINSVIGTNSNNEISELNKITTNSLKVNNAIITNSYCVPSTLSAYDYCDFKPLKISIDQNANLLCYSPLLNMIVVFHTVTGGTTQNVLYSYDKGETWNTKYTTIPAINYNSYNNRIIIWSTIHNCFILHTNSNFLYYSYDGLTWTSFSLATSIFSIYLDTINNRVILSGSSITYYNNTPSNLTSWPSLTTANNSNFISIVYSSFFSKILAINTSKNRIYVGNETTFVTAFENSAYPTSINDLCAVPTGVLICGGQFIYKKIALGGNTTAGTVMYTGSSNLIIQKFFNFTDSNIIALCNTGYLVSSNYGDNWNYMTYSYNNFGDIYNKIYEGTYSEIIWDGEKLIYKSSNFNGVCRLLGSSPFIKNDVTMDYLINKKKSNLDEESFKTGSYASGFNILPPVSGYTLYNSCKGNGYYLHVGSNRILYSSNNFRNVPTSVTLSGEWVGCIYGDKFVICSLDNIAYSSDLTNWTTVLKTGNWKGITYGNNKYVTCALNTISYSSDGITWTDVAVSGTWSNIRYVNNMFFLVGTNNIAYSKDAINWTTVSNNGNWKDVVYGKRMYILSGEFCMSRSYDLITFVKSQVIGNYVSICYSQIYNRFYALSNERKKYVYITNTPYYNRDLIISSSDGYNWIPSNNTAFALNTTHESVCSSINFDEDLSCFYITFSYSSTNYYLAYSKYCNANKNNTIIAAKNTIENNNGKIAIANSTLTTTYPATFNLFVNSAAKPATSTWKVSSDERLKENIEPADLTVCYNNVKSLDLKKYKWKDQFLEDTQETDKHKLGWIAQEVEQIIPKAVTKSELYGLEDCRSLNNDQIIANLYGCVQYLMKKIEEKETLLETRNTN